MEIDDLFPVAETLQMMRFAELEGGDLKLTDVGVAFANAALDERKRIFSRHLLNYVPLAAHVRRVLDERPSHVRAKAASSTSSRTSWRRGRRADAARHRQLGPICRGVRVRRRELQLRVPENPS